LFPSGVMRGSSVSQSCSYSRCFWGPRAQGNTWPAPLEQSVPSCHVGVATWERSELPCSACCACWVLRCRGHLVRAADAASSTPGRRTGPSLAPLLSLLRLLCRSLQGPLCGAGHPERLLRPRLGPHRHSPVCMWRPAGLWPQGLLHGTLAVTLLLGPARRAPGQAGLWGRAAASFLSGVRRSMGAQVGAYVGGEGFGEPAGRARPFSHREWLRLG
jgi:hypothetical protein